jgi:hypothetical protein
LTFVLQNGFIAAGFLLGVIIQLFLCYKVKKFFPDIIPLLIAVLLYAYALARFSGLISFADDINGIYDGGLISAVKVFFIATSFLVGVIAAWLLFGLRGLVCFLKAR